MAGRDSSSLSEIQFQREFSDYRITLTDLDIHGFDAAQVLARLGVSDEQWETSAGQPQPPLP